MQQLSKRIRICNWHLPFPFPLLNSKYHPLHNQWKAWIHPLHILQVSIFFCETNFTKFFVKILWSWLIGPFLSSHHSGFYFQIHILRFNFSNTLFYWEPKSRNSKYYFFGTRGEPCTTSKSKITRFFQHSRGLFPSNPRWNEKIARRITNPICQKPGWDQ